MEEINIEFVFSSMCLIWKNDRAAQKLELILLYHTETRTHSAVIRLILKKKVLIIRNNYRCEPHTESQQKVQVKVFKHKVLFLQ